MKTTVRLFAAMILGIIALNGCNGNIFSSFDTPPPPPSASEMEDQALDDIDQFVRDIEDWIATDSFGSSDYENATGALRAVADPASPAPVEKKQKAAATAGQVTILSDDNATDVVQNLTGVLEKLTDDVEDEPEDIIDALVPDFPDTPEGREEFEQMIATLQSAAGDFSTFADLIENNPDVEPDLNSGEQGDAIQMAVLALVVDTAANNLSLDDGDGDGLPDGDGVDALWQIIQTGDATGTNIDSEDPLQDLEEPGTDIYTILEYAGLQDLFNEGSN